MDNNWLKEELKNRNINSLIHFTETVNLQNILNKKFIFSKKTLQNDKSLISPITEFNDSHRLDGFLDYINLSITKPNKKLFNVFRKRKVEAYIKWCVIQLSPDLLFESEFLFTATNAASNAVKKDYPPGNDQASFSVLFSDTLKVKTSSRINILNRNGLKKNETTDNQAEILVKDKISIDHINNIYFQNQEDLNAIKSGFKILGLPTNKFFVEEDIFT